MRITKISIRDLFGIESFSYDIELKNEYGITIIHGPNGSGKTVLFKMIDGLFNERYSVFWQYPFRQFIVHFNDGENITVSRMILENKIDFGFPTIQYSKAPEQLFEMKREPRSLARRSIRINFPDDLPPEDMRIFLEQITSEEKSMRSDSQFPYSEDEQEHPQWLGGLSKDLNVIFIDTNRLLIPNPKREDRNRTQRQSKTIQQNSEDLSKKIQGLIFKADAESKMLDSSFPKRIVERVLQQVEDPMDYTTIKEQLQKLQEKRSGLIDSGLIEPDKDDTTFDIPDMEKDTQQERTLRTVLEMYIGDTGNKLEVYQELANKIKLFKEIVQGVFSNKEIHISKDGFKIKSSVARDIPLDELSSGEQHLLVLVYKLLFRLKTQVDELILIDEPEISLHITWQKRFIDDLIEINKLTEGQSKLDIVIATHSPAIINGRLDMLVGIQGSTGKD